jgi:hypothetical protein
MRILMLCLCVLAWPGVPAAAGTGSGVTGRIIDQSELPLPGVTVVLQPPPPASPLTASTDADGRFAFDVPPGTYQLAADLSGFTHLERTVVVSEGVATVDLTMMVTLNESVSVSAAAPAPAIGAPTPAAEATVSRDVIEASPRQNNTFDDVLPLLPTVVRGPDGLISVAGSRAPQGQMLVDGFSQNDPVLGEPDVQLPVDPVASMQVLTNGYAAEYGRAAAGVTLVHMRGGSDRFRFSVDSFDPRLHFQGGGIHGVEAWEPDMGVSGPIVKGRLWFAQALDYRYVRDYYETVNGNQSSKYTAGLSWTSLDWQAGKGHRLSAWLALDPQKTDHIDIGAFTPQDTVPGLTRGGPRLAVEDHLVVGLRSTLEIGAQASSIPTQVTPNGTAPYLVGHDVATGSYFDQQDRRASRDEVTGVFTRTSGGHLVKAGGLVGRMAFDGTETASPVEQLRSDGTVARTIAFSGPAHLAASTRELGAFVQDTWTVTPRVTIDAGVRYDRSSIAADGVLGPRFGIVWKVDTHTTITGSAGVFGDKLPLAAAAFPQYPSRTITVPDDSGGDALQAVPYLNLLPRPLRTPRATAWNVQFDRRFDSGFVARVGYLERSGSDEPIVDVDPAAGALVLTSGGRSRSRSLETTIGYRIGDSGQSVFVSYVRASARGDLNDFVSLFGNLIEPFVQPNATGPLAVDVPNRVLTWAVIAMPWQITLAPFLEIRSGFPYSPIDDGWNDVGPRNGERFPAFAAFDFYVAKIVKLPHGLPDARVGVKLYNLTGTGNWRDIQRDLARPDFGTLYNPVPREIRSVFEILWGR